MSTVTAQLPGWTGPIDIYSKLAPSSQTITKAVAYRFGADLVLQITYSDSSVGYVKWKQGRLKVGGADNTFGTGTEFYWGA